ncbi:hypothetical protein X975_16225, partial [Stegodyphus mimosarum]
MTILQGCVPQYLSSLLFPVYPMVQTLCLWRKKRF